MPSRKTPSIHVLLGVLEALPPGQRLWVHGVGACLAPLLRGGDAVRVLRCGPGALERGDVALLRQGRKLVAQVVVSTRPWRTAPLLGGADAPGGVTLGRVVAVKRGRWVVPLPRPFRPALWMTQRTLAAVWARPGGRVVYRRVRDFFFSGWSRPFRRRLVGPLEVRLLRADDLDALLVFAGERLVVSTGFLRRQLRERWGLDASERRGAAAGAFDAEGRIRGFAWVDSYRQEALPLDGVWVRSLVVAPQARRMGVATRLLECLMAEARRQGEPRIQADVDDDNVASLHTFAGLGFRPAPPELTRRTNQAWDAAGRAKALVVLERELTP
ncbi:GNAT family N-acetyltransferase [Pyxidicoccus parkwayensis]|uniref:GNAT family N-acetyltransferase n=1 Tax=Pyxidicoccus parkwayensis TaxID=2813578 RepID=A0ABX7P2H0_9BACT|nr:GNAT family N-acetyltransferase [Pyxidicoccus parkwaysis]QSQ23618.1 GNAT family N-acetyltransferase [Pyxidicoccus parkwaysis]